MRMSSFLLGGLVGAAAAVCFSRSRRPMLMSSINRAAAKVGRFMNTINPGNESLKDKMLSDAVKEAADRM